MARLSEARARRRGFTPLPDFVGTPPQGGELIMVLRGSLPHRGRKQVDFANEVKRNRYGFPADTKYRGNVSPRREQSPRPRRGGPLAVGRVEKTTPCHKRENN